MNLQKFSMKNSGQLVKTAKLQKRRSKFLTFFFSTFLVLLGSFFAQEVLPEISMSRSCAISV